MQRFSLLPLGAALLLSLGLLAASTATAQVPDSMAYQGYLTDPDGLAITDDNAALTFRLYDTPSGGQALWTETHTGVAITAGIFSVMLGGVEDLSEVSFARPLWMSVAVGDAGSEELSPRVALEAAPYALSLRGLRVEPVTNAVTGPTPNLIGGYAGNRVMEGVLGATISGGGVVDQGAIRGSNEIMAILGTIGGGWGNTASGQSATVGGGSSNTAEGTHSAIGGGSGNMAIFSAATVGGGSDNRASGEFSTVGGGINNTASSPHATVPGGSSNEASEDGATVGGGINNTASGSSSTLGGGSDNMASGSSSTLGGGSDNMAGGDFSTLGGGQQNEANGEFATVGGGASNIASGDLATVPGGLANEAGGDYSFAAGRRAKAMHDGAFVWADATNEDFASQFDNQFRIRAGGGARFDVNNNQWVELRSRVLPGIPPNSTVSLLINTSTGAYLSTGGEWVNNSDRALKTQVAPVDGQAILRRLAALPIARWRYKASPSVSHIGPMAQDFYAAFGVGASDRHISTVDADGVALAALQGLYQLVQEKDARIATLEARLADLEAVIEAQQVTLEAFHTELETSKRHGAKHP